MTDLNEARQAHEAGKWDALKRLAEANVGLDDVRVAPDVLLELIADNDFNRGKHKWLKGIVHMMVTQAMPLESIPDLPGYQRVVEAYKLFAQIDQLTVENESLREALQAISNEIEGNTRCLIRDLVNNAADLGNGAHPNDLYEDCDRIEGIIEAALAREVQA